MAITVVCSCGKKFQVKDELAGRRGKCAACGQSLTIPSPQAAPADPLGPLGGVDLNALGGFESQGDPLGGPLSSAPTGPALAASPGLPASGFGGMGAGAPGMARPAAKGTAAAKETPFFLRWYVLAGAGGVLLLLVVAGIVAVVAYNSAPAAVAVQSPTVSPPVSPSSAPAPSNQAPSNPAPPPAAVSAPAMRVSAAAEVSLEPGVATFVDVKVDRGGLVGPIQISADSLPDKVTAAQVEIPPDQSACRLTFATANDALEGGKPGRIVAVAGNARVEHPIAVAVKKVVPPILLPIAAVALTPGGSTAVDIKVERNGHQGPIQIQVEGLPDKVVAKPLGITADQNSGKLELSAAADVAEASKGVRVLANVAGRNAEAPLQVSVEKFTFRLLPLPVVWVRPAEKATVEVKVERRSHQGPIELSVQGLPDDVTAAPATIPAGQVSTRLELTAGTAAKDKVRSGKLTATAGTSSGDKLLVVRVKKSEGMLLPEVAVDPELRGLLKRGSFGGRLTVESKQALMDIFGGTKESEAAVMAGLRWLDKHQSSDGHWSLESYNQFGTSCDCEIPFEDKVDINNTAATALGVLPFLGAGVTPNSAPESPKELKKYQKTVKTALEYLAKNQKTSTDDNNGDLGGGMYAHALGTIALCEAYALTKDAELRVPAQKAVRYLLQAQHAGGGWGYGPKQEGDTSVVAWVFLGIRSGQMSGMPIEPRILSQADKFLNSTSAGDSESLKKSRYSYKPGTGPTPALTAAGLLSRQYLGWQQDKPELIEGCKFIMQRLPQENQTAVGPNYEYYYATQVLHHMEGKDWDLWNHHMREHLLRTQEKTGHKQGSWSPEGSDHGNRGGRMYSTALSLLTLEVYYRHLPLYRKVPKSVE